MSEREKKTVLILEDEETTLTVLSEGLKKAGYRTLPFQRPDSACVEALVNQQVDLILLDLGLFNFDATQIMKFLREKKVAGQIPIIIVSGKTLKEIEKSAKELKAKDWIAKPFKLEEAIKRVRDVLGP